MKITLKQSGFSLLELILVIVLLGVLAGGAGLLITKPIEAYSDQLRRQHLVDQGEMALRQIARDLRRALPNSVRVAPAGAGWALEMVNTVDGARYRDEVGGDYTAAADWLDFTAADDSFNLLGLLPTGALGPNHRLVIYNTAPASIYADITDIATPNEGIVTSGGTALGLALVNPNPATNDDENRITMAPAFRFTQQSPGQRIFVIDGPVSYVCNPATNTLTRYDNYAYQDPQLTSDVALTGLAGVQSGAVVDQLDSCTINYAAGTTQRGSLVSMTIVLNDPAVPGERISLYHQVHVLNVP